MANTDLAERLARLEAKLTPLKYHDPQPTGLRAEMLAAQERRRQQREQSAAEQAERDRLEEERLRPAREARQREIDRVDERIAAAQAEVERLERERGAIIQAPLERKRLVKL